MLNKEDLRIGNYIFGKPVQGAEMDVIKILDLRDDGIVTSSFKAVRSSIGVEIVNKNDDKLTLPYVWAEGIPIDNEWLTRVRAQVPNGDEKMQIGIVFFKRLMHIGLMICNEKWEPLKDTGIVRYVHQVQNLNFEVAHELIIDL